MARIPQFPYRAPHKRHERETDPMVKPEGKFKRPSKISLRTDRSPKNVTSLNAEDMMPILPEMPYIPPA